MMLDILLFGGLMWLTSREIWNMLPVKWQERFGHDGEPLIIDDKST